jgi:hypothetical protein
LSNVSWQSENSCAAKPQILQNTNVMGRYNAMRPENSLSQPGASLSHIVKGILPLSGFFVKLNLFSSGVRLVLYLHPEF